MDRRLAARAALLCFILPVLHFLTGCASIPYEYPRTPSSALYRPEGTTMGKRVQAQAADHPGDSGFFLLPTAIDSFAARIRLIDQAEKTLDLQYYIFHDDRTGKYTLDRIINAADRGVKVRLLLDDWHQTQKTDWLMAALAVHPNVEVRIFNPFGTQRASLTTRVLKMALGPQRLRGRMHNKAFIADNSMAIVGGRNIGDEYFGASEGANFSDVDILTLGQVTRQISSMFDDYWNCVLAVPLAALMSRQPTADDLRAVRRDLEVQKERLEKSTYWLRVQQSDLLEQIDAGKIPVVWSKGEVHADHPLKCIDPEDPQQSAKMTRELMAVLEEAKDEILLISPYLVPGEAGMRLFKQVRDRGVTVKIITNSFASNDVQLAQIVYNQYRTDLLRMGVELFELKTTVVHLPHERGQLAGDVRHLFGSVLKSGGSLIQRGASHLQLGGSALRIGGSTLHLGAPSRGALHAKTFVLDHRAVFVGSFNFDPRSMRLDTQNGLVIRSPVLANQGAWLFAQGSSLARTYRVLLLEDNDLVWVTKDEEGKEVRCYQEPDSTLLQRFTQRCLAWLTPESVL